MKTDKIIDAMQYLDEDILAEVNDVRAGRKKAKIIKLNRWMKVLSTAACLALVVMITGTVMLSRGPESKANDSAPATASNMEAAGLEAEVAEDVPDNAAEEVAEDVAEDTADESQDENASDSIDKEASLEDKENAADTGNDNDTIETEITYDEADRNNDSYALEPSSAEVADSSSGESNIWIPVIVISTIIFLGSLAGAIVLKIKGRK